MQRQGERKRETSCCVYDELKFSWPLSPTGSKFLPRFTLMNLYSSSRNAREREREKERERIAVCIEVSYEKRTDKSICPRGEKIKERLRYKCDWEEETSTPLFVSPWLKSTPLNTKRHTQTLEVKGGPHDTGRHLPSWFNCKYTTSEILSSRIQCKLHPNCNCKRKRAKFPRESGWVNALTRTLVSPLASICHTLEPLVANVLRTCTETCKWKS